METSEYFERTLFHDGGPEANRHYEDCAGSVFDERCADTPVEARIPSRSKFVETATKQGLPSGTQFFSQSDHCSDYRLGQALSVKGGCDPVIPKDANVCPDSAEDGRLDDDDNSFVSSRASSTGLTPSADQNRDSSRPPIYPGRAGLAVLQLAPCDIVTFVRETKNDFRVFYLRQRHSYSRLQITKDTFERLLYSCHVFPRFTEYVTGLCAKTSDAEVGPPPLKFRPLRSTSGNLYRGFECCYILRYVEKTQRGGGRKPWSLRQFAVYNRYKPAQNSPCSTWILAGVSHCTETLLDGYTQNVRNLAEANPLELHMILLDRCITNWRPYLAHLTSLVKEQSGKCSGFTLSGDQSKNLVTITVDDHQQLKEIEDDVADMVLCLDSSLDTLTSFMRMYEDFRRHIHDAQPKVDAHVGGLSKADAVVIAFEEKAQEVSYTRKKAESLLSKIRNTRKLVSSLLERQSAYNINKQIGALQSLERQGQQENKSMRQLTEKSSRDSSIRSEHLAFLCHISAVDCVYLLCLVPLGQS
ncbi:hypothetical protein C7974DRAFT_130747 [Boeremia exigua]|uniref:uncharacterized protein n=1 Tax=Boeremia exigua TaxID=749465 RepID=UPI001E8CCCBB|nr:uncharacterized protein C7974DRAFT_130747 [Boeremia exigua]KAH6639407.1 hypothetical protein C7974DRAFT_130747 [Boeremia exigua]